MIYKFNGKAYKLNIYNYKKTTLTKDFAFQKRGKVRKTFFDDIVFFSHIDVNFFAKRLYVGKREITRIGRYYEI